MVPGRTACATRGTPASAGQNLRSLAAEHLRALLHRLHDVDVAGAAAEIAFQAVNDVFLGRLGVVLEQARYGHDHSRGAETALQSVALRERLLDGMELAVLRHPLDRQHVGAVRL